MDKGRNSYKNANIKSIDDYIKWYENNKLDYKSGYDDKNWKAKSLKEIEDTNQANCYEKAMYFLDSIKYLKKNKIINDYSIYLISNISNKNAPENAYHILTILHTNMGYNSIYGIRKNKPYRHTEMDRLKDSVFYGEEYNYGFVAVRLLDYELKAGMTMQEIHDMYKKKRIVISSANGIIEGVIMDINNMIESMWLTEGKPNKKLLNDGDKKDHMAVAALIRNKEGDILIQYHNKYNMITFPVGKVDEGEDDLEESLKREIKEECNLIINEMQKLFSFTKIYDRDKIRVAVVCHLYEVIEYSGNMKNAEPEKHKWMKFLPIDEILKYKPSDRSDVLNEYLKFIQIGESLEEEIEAESIGLLEYHVLNEYYFGKNPTLLDCEKRLSNLKIAVNKSPFKGNFNDPDVNAIENNLRKLFNVQSVTLNITSDSANLSGYTFPVGMCVNLSNDDMEVIRESKGMRFKNPDGKHMVIGLNNYTLNNLTTGEIMGIILHEVGHNFFVSPVNTVLYKMRWLVSVLNLIISILVMGVSPIVGIAFAVGFILYGTSGVRKFYAKFLEKNKNSKNATIINNILSSGLGTLLTLNDIINTLYDRIMIPLNFVGYLLSAAIYAPINLITSFLLKGHTNEKFADNFASSYGYGADLATSIANGKYEMNFNAVDKYINYIPILRVINKTTIDILRFVGSLTDEHPTELQRVVSQIQFYKAELEKGDYPKEIKKELQKNLDDCLILWDKINDPKYLLKNNSYIKAVIVKLFGKDNIDKKYDIKEVLNPTESFDYEEMK